jgi:hypothetical protein
LEVYRVKQIAAALVKAQQQFQPALKTSSNPHFRTKYADLGACVEAVIGALNSNGIAMLQRTERDETGVTVETVFLHESGESWSSGPLHVPASKSDPQGYGSALTYARRYSLMAACGHAPEDDDGNAASRRGKPDAAQAAQRREAWLEEQAHKLEACKSPTDLQAVWALAYKAMKAENDADGIATLTPIKDRVKRGFE